MPRVKRAGFVLERDSHPDQRAECLLSPHPSLTGCLQATSEFLVWTSEQKRQMRQCSSIRHCGSWMAGQRLWHTRRACTTAVTQDNTRWQTKARARHRIVIWLTSDATSRCVGTDQEHSSLMGEHCLGCSTLPTFYHGISSHAFLTQCVRVRVSKHPRRGREETRWRLFVPTDMAPPA